VGTGAGVDTTAGCAKPIISPESEVPGGSEAIPTNLRYKSSFAILWSFLSSSDYSIQIFSRKRIVVKRKAPQVIVVRTQSELLYYPFRQGQQVPRSKINREHILEAIRSCAIGSRVCTRPRMDNLTRAQRSATMARVRSRDTKPELVVRRLVHALGYRYQLYRSTLPGKPDLVFPRHSKAILVHGCFWRCGECGAHA
jgi:hypothetical protein